MDYLEREYLKNNDVTNFDHKLNAIFRSCTPPLCVFNKEKKGRVEGVASSLFLSYRSNKYIVTAGHTFRNYDYNDVFYHPLNLSISDDCQGIIFLPRKEALGQELDYSEMDYGIFKLGESSSRKLEEYYQPYHIPESVKSNQFTPLNTFVFGYPSSQNVQRLVKYPFVAKHHLIRVPLCFDVDDIGSGFDEVRNLALRFSIGHTIRTENIARGSSGRAPKPNGMSGCGMWAVDDYPFRLRAFSLQGMLTHYNEKKALLIGLRVIDIAYQIELVDSKLPELKAKQKDRNIWFSLSQEEISEKQDLVVD